VTEGCVSYYYSFVRAFESDCKVYRKKSHMKQAAMLGTDGGGNLNLGGRTSSERLPLAGSLLSHSLSAVVSVVALFFVIFFFFEPCEERRMWGGIGSTLHPLLLWAVAIAFFSSSSSPQEALSESLSMAYDGLWHHRSHAYSYNFIELRGCRRMCRCMCLAGGYATCKEVSCEHHIG